MTMLTLNDGRSELWQWDTGRKLTVEGDCSQVHFSNKFFGRSIDVDVVDGVAIIPDVLLQTDKDLIAWAFVGSAENGYTKISKVFKVNKRNKPADYVFTPPDQTTLQEILSRLEEVENKPDGGITSDSIAEALGYVPGQELVIGNAEVNEEGRIVVYVPTAATIKTGTLVCYRLASQANEIASNVATINGKTYLFVSADGRKTTLNAKELHEKNDTIIIRIDEEIGDPLFAQVIATVPKEQDTVEVTAESITAALGYTPANKAVLYDQVQELTEEQKAQARKNSGSASQDDIRSMKEQQPNLFMPDYQEGNLLDNSKMLDGYYINASGGTTAATFAICSEEYIDISKAQGTHLAVYACLNNVAARCFYRMCFYDENKTKIYYSEKGGGASDLTRAYVEIPEGAVYARVSFGQKGAVYSYMVLRGSADMPLENYKAYEPLGTVIVPKDLDIKLATLDEMAKAAAFTSSSYKGKYVSFYGDSITTFTGYIPEGNISEYSGSSLGVTSVDQTWWKMTLDALGMNLLVNNSWSGRCVTTIRDTSESHLNSAGCRAENIQILKTDERDPDVIIVKLGVNDFLRIGSVSLGSYDAKETVPTEPSNDFSSAYALMLNNIRTAFPNAELWCCTINQMSRKAFPNVIGGVSLDEINDVIIKLAAIWGAKVIRHDECGITVFNGETVFGDYANNMGLHPNATGHSMIATTTIRTMLSK